MCPPSVSPCQSTCTHLTPWAAAMPLHPPLNQPSTSHTPSQPKKPTAPGRSDTPPACSCDFPPMPHAMAVSSSGKEVHDIGVSCCCILGRCMLMVGMSCRVLAASMVSTSSCWHRLDDTHACIPCNCLHWCHCTCHLQACHIRCRCRHVDHTLSSGCWRRRSHSRARRGSCAALQRRLDHHAHAGRQRLDERGTPRRWRHRHCSGWWDGQVANRGRRHRCHTLPWVGGGGAGGHRRPGRLRRARRARPAHRSLRRHQERCGHGSAGGCPWRAGGTRGARPARPTARGTCPAS
mmetsp:Transcript_36375/g.91840  ORF Transcript_36375/g.91840 Transcript_36375/m.91840 type:complete len:292 (+) Transcript_36375:456-1331(+)